jgi:dTDP-4-amino-4,6-dideoxygalactose transaminase
MKALNIKAFETPIYVTRPIFPDMQEVVAKLEEIWASRWFTNNGEQHQQLEQALKRLMKVPHLSLFNNGTVALDVANHHLKFSGEVITTPFTFPATPHALQWSGITPVFCDIDPVTLNIDPTRIESLITPKTTGIVGVHVYGIPCDIAGIQQIAESHGLKVMYDAAHAFGVEIDGVGIGNFGDATMFSFHATKLFHTMEGGALAVKSPEAKAEIDLMKNFGIQSEEEVVMPGINGKMTEFQAAVGLVNLNYIEEEIRQRKINTETYLKCLSGINGITCLELPPGVKGSYQYFVIRIHEEEFGRSRDWVYQALKDYNVFTRKYFYPLCSDIPCYRDLPSAQPENLPIAHKAVREVLCLPLYGALTADEITRICELITSFKG